LIALRGQVDNARLEARLSGKPKEERWGLAVEEMQGFSAKTQQGLLEVLRSGESAGRVSDIRLLWIVNAVSCRLAPEAVEMVLSRDEVWYVERSEVPSLGEIAPGPRPFSRVDPNAKAGLWPAVEWHVRKVGADSVWRYRNLWGQNVVVALIGSGVNYRHRDLKDHLWTDANYPNHGWNFEQNTDDPMDFKGFGTHQAGVIAGDGTSGDTCGIAPQAEVMALRVRTTLRNPLPDTLAENQALAAIQFAVAPPLSPAHHAHVIALAWGFQQEWLPRRALWRAALTNASQAGLICCVAAGNERGVPVPKALRTPGDAPGPWKHPAEDSGGVSGAITLGATDSLDDIAWFSSPGPAAWDSVAPYNDYPFPPGLLKPDLSAPGHNLTSLAYDNNQGYYPSFSGTGHSAAVAAGVAALMLSRNPALLPRTVDSLLQTTVRPRGTQPKNNDFGTGRIRALGAVDAVPIANEPQLVHAGSEIRDTLGNRNGLWDPGEVIGLVDTLANLGKVQALGVSGVLTTSDPYVTVLDSVGYWSDMDSLSRRANSTDTFALRAGLTTPPGHLATLKLALEANGGAYRTTVFIALPIGRVKPTDPLGPDAHGYYAMDDLDTLYENPPIYEWVELDTALGGQGLPVGPGGDDVTYVWPVAPIGIKYYGIRFDSLSIGSNGFLQLGETSWTWPANARVPSTSAPSFGVFPFWDDLRTDLGARWWFLADTVKHRVVVEWDSVALWRDTLGYTRRQSFQVILNDTTRTPGTARTNDSEVFLQWRVVADSSSVTVGQQNGSQTLGLQALFNGDYDPSVFPIGPGRCLRFSTDPPIPRLSGVSAEVETTYPLQGLSLSTPHPNPLRGAGEVSFSIPVSGPVSLRVYNLLGQQVKALVHGLLQAGVHRVCWDGRDDRGTRVGSGVYFIRLESGGASRTARALLLR
jgi:subtilisin family serine protease